MSGVITGEKPYRFLDETSVGNGYVRLRALVLLPLLSIVLGSFVLGYEYSSPVGDRDVRDMAWDYRVTNAMSTAFHAYFRHAYWSSYRELDDNSEVYREVVVAAVDRPVVLAIHPPAAACKRVVSVPCLANLPTHRDETANGPLNLGTDVGVWAVGNGRALERTVSGTTALRSDGVLSVPNAYTNAADLATYWQTRRDELEEMRAKSASAVLNAGVASANNLDCPGDNTGATCAWDETQWSTWAGLAFGTLGSTNCDVAIDACGQTKAALETAATATSAAGKVAVRVVTGSWTTAHPHLGQLATPESDLPKVMVVTDDGSDELTAAATPAAWNPLTDVVSGDATAWVSPAAAAAIVDAAAGMTGGGEMVGYILPPDADTRENGLRGGVTIHGARADLETSFETRRTWRTRKAFAAPLFDIGMWPWPGQCPDTALNATVARDEELYVPGFPAFNARGDAPTVPVTALGETRNVPAYRSDCDFDAVDAGASGDAVTCAVEVLSGIEIGVAFTPVAGTEFGGWRLAYLEPSYGEATSGTLTGVFAGTETEAIAEFGSNTARAVSVTMRDAGAPEVFRAPPLGTPTRIYATIGFFAFAFFVAPVHPYLMTVYVRFNVAVNQGKPPPGWQQMRRFRGW